MIRTLGNVLLITAAVPAVASLALHLLTPWRRTQYGRHLLVYMGALAGLLATWTIGRLFGVGQTIGFQGFLVGAFGLFTLALWHRLYLQVQAHREDRKARKENLDG